MKLITKENIRVPFIIMDAFNHESTKPLLLLDISKSVGIPVEPTTHRTMKVSKSDYDIDKFTARSYLVHLQDYMKIISSELTNHFKYPSSLQVEDFWYEKYKKGDYRSWSSTSKATFSCVYFVELPKDSSKISFKLLDIEFDVDEIEEGQILIFPTFLLNSIKEHTSDKEKTLVWFNLRHFGV